MEITAFAARRKVLFNALTIDNYIEDIFTALYTGFPAQLVNSCCIFAEDICKKKFYLIDSVGNIETIPFNFVAKSLKQWSVVGILNLCLTIFAFSADISPTAFSVGLIG